MSFTSRAFAVAAAFAVMPSLVPAAGLVDVASALPGQDRRISSAVGDATAAVSAALYATDRFGYPVVSPALFERTECVIGMRITRGAFLLGGQGGEGMMSCRLPDGSFSAPSFLRTGGFDLSAAIGFDVMDIAMLITDRGLAESYKSQFNLSTRAYAVAVAANASAAIDAANRHGMAVLQTNRAGLFAGVGITFASLSHMPARNQIVYETILGGGVPTDRTGRACSNYLLPVRRNACIADYQARVGIGAQVTSADILALPGFQAPAIAQPFVKMLDRAGN